MDQRKLARHLTSFATGSSVPHRLKWIEDRNFDLRPQGGEASEGSRKGRGAAPPPGRRLTDRRGAVCGRHSSTVRRISARRVVAERCLALPPAPGRWRQPRQSGGIRVKREPRRLREAERGPGSRGEPRRQGGRGCGG